MTELSSLTVLKKIVEEASPRRRAEPRKARIRAVDRGVARLDDGTFIPVPHGADGYVPGARVVVFEGGLSPVMVKL